MSERKFSKEFRDILNKRGLRCHTIENKVAPGMPDILVCRDFKEAIWIELKVASSINLGLSNNQILWIRVHPEETVLLATQITNSKKFKLSKWNGEESGWDVLLKDEWPLLDEGELASTIYEL